jgi:signal transduction histidine kinase
MTYFVFAALFTLSLAVLSGLFVFWKNPRGLKNIVFVPFAGSLALWSFFYILWLLSATGPEALHYIRIAVACAAFVPVTNFHAVLKILDIETPLRRRFVKIFYFLSALIVLTAPTRYFITGVVPRAGFPYWPLPGPIFNLHVINLSIVPVWLTYLLWKEKEKASPLQKNKFKWLLYGHVIAYIGGGSNNLLWYNIPIKPYLTILTPIAMIMTAAIYYRPAAIDFNYLVRRAFLYGAQMALSSLIPLLCLLPLVHRLPLGVLIGFAGLLALIVNPIVSKIFKPSLQFEKVGRDKIKESTFTYQDLAQNIVDLTLSTVSVESAGIYFFDLTKGDYYLCAQKGMKNKLAGNLRYNRSGLSLMPDDPLIERLNATRAVVHREIILNDLREHDQPVIASMDRMEAEIAEPFIFGGKLRGILVVGAKRNAGLFNDEELDLIESYAQMGTEVMRTIMAMETELNQTTLYSHDINHDIRSITQTLQFLRSPMAKTLAEPKLQALLEQGENVAERLYEWFQANRDRSSMIMRAIRGEYERTPINLPKVLKLSTGKFVLQAESAHVNYVVDVPPSDHTVMGNEVDVTRVFDNLISNALRHLPPSEGRIEVTGRPEGNFYVVSVRDNGEGIDPADLAQIWQLGWQGKDSKKGSAGFGLAIVRQIVQIHGGTIQAKSQGKGTGTEFLVSLPCLLLKDKP